MASPLSANRSAEELAELTCLPVPFTAVVIANMDYNQLWNSDWFDDVCKALRAGTQDLKAVEDAMNGLLTEFWNDSELPGVREILPALRGPSLLFGKPQTWIDKDFLEELLGPKLVYGQASLHCG